MTQSLRKRLFFNSPDFRNEEKVERKIILNLQNDISIIRQNFKFANLKSSMIPAKKRKQEQKHRRQEQREWQQW